MPTQVRLPDELWSQILGNLTYRDLCSVSITCKRLYRISGEDSLWSHLLSSDFAVPPLPNLSIKSNYRYRLTRKRELIEAEKRREKGKKELREMNRMLIARALRRDIRPRTEVDPDRLRLHMRRFFLKRKRDMERAERQLPWL